MVLPKEIQNKRSKNKMNTFYNDNENLINKTMRLLSCIVENEELDNESKKEIHDFIIERIKTFSEYIQATNTHVYTIQSITMLRNGNIIDQDEFERRLKDTDTNRRGKHNLAIDACNQLNRQCDLYQIPRICDIDTKNRAEVANFAAQFAMATHGYALNHNYTMDEVVNMLQQNSELLENSNIFERG